MKVSSSHLLSDIDAIIKRSPTHNGSANHQIPLKQIDKKSLEVRVINLEEQIEQLISYIHFLFQSTIHTNGSAGTAHTTPAGTTHAKKEAPLLTKREIEVFNLLAEGLCAKEIAKKLSISESTVITHKKNLKSKFHAKNSVQLISNILGGT